MSTTTLDRQYVLRLPSDLLDRLSALARTGDRTLAHEMRRALRLYAAELEGKPDHRPPNRER